MAFVDLEYKKRWCVYAFVYIDIDLKQLICMAFVPKTTHS